MALNHEGVSFFLWLVGGAVVGAFAAIATGGRGRLVVSLVVVVAVTVAAFIVMPWDDEAEAVRDSCCGGRCSRLARPRPQIHTRRDSQLRVGTLRIQHAPFRGD
jgi:hypothetical protein